MIYLLTVPGPIDDVEEIRVLEWHRDEGAALGRGDLFVELETSKAVVEIFSRQRAHLRRILCKPGDWQQLGKPIAVFSDSPDEDLPVALDELPLLEVDFTVT